MERVVSSHLGGAAALAAAMVLTVACGASPTTATGARASSTAAAVTLAPGASHLCGKPPAAGNPLFTALNSAQSGWPSPSSAGGLSPVMADAPGDDGWSTPGTAGGRQAIQVIPGQSSSGSPFTYTELYFTSAGVVPPSTANVMLCLQYLDGPAGADIGLQYSGTNTSGPVNGAYDAAPEVYATKGTNKWLVGSFTMTAIHFASGGAGAGAENYGADFRVTGGNATPFWVDAAWLVISHVPAAQSLAAVPTPSSATSG